MIWQTLKLSRQNNDVNNQYLLRTYIIYLEADSLLLNFPFFRYKNFHLSKTFCYSSLPPSTYYLP